MLSHGGFVGEHLVAALQSFRTFLVHGNDVTLKVVLPVRDVFTFPTRVYLLHLFSLIAARAWGTWGRVRLRRLMGRGRNRLRFLPVLVNVTVI